MSRTRAFRSRGACGPDTIAATASQLVSQVHDVSALPVSWKIWAVSLLLASMPWCFALPVPLQQWVIAIGVSLTTLALGMTCLFQRYLKGVDRRYLLSGGAVAVVEKH